MKTVDGGALDYSTTGNWHRSVPGHFVTLQLPFSFALIKIMKHCQSLFQTDSKLISQEKLGSL